MSMGESSCVLHWKLPCQRKHGFMDVRSLQLDVDGLGYTMQSSMVVCSCDLAGLPPTMQ